MFEDRKRFDGTHHRRFDGVLFAGALIVTTILLVGCGRSPDEGVEDPFAEQPRKTSKAPIVGGVRVLPNKGGLEIQGLVCMEEGVLDFLAVMRGGREYESILTLECKPSALHAALLAIGAKPGPTPAYIEWQKQRQEEDKGKSPTGDKPSTKVKPPAGDKPVTPAVPGSKLTITVYWKTPDGKSKGVPATSLLFNRKTKKVEPESNAWIFTGSYFGKTLEDKKVYVADVDGAVISVIQDPTAVISLAVDAGNPYDSDDQGFQPNEKLLLKMETPVLVRIKLAPDN